MKTNKIYLRYTCWVLLALATLACDTTVKTDDAEVGAAVRSLSPGVPGHVFRIDTANSTVSWIGAKVTGRHYGIIPISDGSITVHRGHTNGGTTLFDMRNVRSEDKSIDEAGNKKLTKHLRSEDFFDVESHPVARFQITSVVPFDSTEPQDAPTPAPNTRVLRIKDPTHKITGNLTIKGVTRSVSFPAKIILSDSVLQTRANFNIDRTHWRLSYGADESLGNKTIHPAVNIGLDIAARKQ